MANADLPEEEERLAAALARGSWSETTDARNDTFAVLRAGLDGTADPRRHRRPRRWGVAVTCGAGINCVGVHPDGRNAGYLALGGISGDWGGGHALGKAALWWAIRAEDGRGPQTALRGAVAAHFGVPSVRDVALGCTSARSARRRCSGSPRCCSPSRAKGDEVAPRPGPPPGRGDLRHGADRHAAPRADRASRPRSCSAAG